MILRIRAIYQYYWKLKKSMWEKKKKNLSLIKSVTGYCHLKWWYYIWSTIFYIYIWCFCLLLWVPNNAMSWVFFYLEMSWEVSSNWWTRTESIYLKDDHVLSMPPAPSPPFFSFHSFLYVFFWYSSKWDHEVYICTYILHEIVFCFVHRRRKSLYYACLSINYYHLN